MHNYFAKIQEALSHMNNAFRAGAVNPMALPHVEQFGRAVAELNAALPPLSELEARIGALEKAFGDLHGALATGGPASVQKAVAEVEMPAANAS